VYSFSKNDELVREKEHIAAFLVSIQYNRTVINRSIEPYDAFLVSIQYNRTVIIDQ
jgi:hypothetical protein